MKKYENGLFLLKKDKKLYAILEDGIEDINIPESELDKNVFMEYGTDDIELLNKYFKQDYVILMIAGKEEDKSISISGFKDLLYNKRNTKILFSRDKKNVIEPELDISGFKDLRLLNCGKSEILVSRDLERDDVPITYIKGYTSPQLVMPSGDIRLNKVSNVNSLELKANDEDELIRIIYSIDGGKTWQSKRLDGNNYINVGVNIDDIEEIIDLGMTVKEFNSINNGWTEDVLKNGKIRFAYLLRLNNIDSKSETDKLEINMSMYGSWLSQVNNDEFKYEYDNDKLILEVYQDGTYKFNYFA